MLKGVCDVRIKIKRHLLQKYLTGRLARGSKSVF